jgi:hypothetical protein
MLGLPVSSSEEGITLALAAALWLDSVVLSVNAFLSAARGKEL